MTSRGTLVRRWLPLVAVLLVAGLALSDYPLGWSVWLEHPGVTGVITGLAWLLLTGAVVDTYLRRREARRWAGVGRAAAVEFSVFFEVNRWVMPQLLGMDFGVRVWPDVEFHLVPARARAAELEPIALDEGTMFRLFVTEEGWPEYEQLMRGRLHELIRDNGWRIPAVMALHTLNRQQAAMIAQWTSLFAVLGDDARFAHVSQTVEIMDRITAMQESAWLIDVSVSAPAFSVDDAEVSRAIESFIDSWVDLARDYADEHAYWAGQVAAEALIPIPPRLWAHTRAATPR